MGGGWRVLTRVSAPVLVLALGCAIAAYFVVSRPRALPQPPQEKIWPVRTATVQRTDVTPSVRVFGEIRAGREAELRALVAGRIVELNPEFRDGAEVVAGTELARIDPVDYEIRLAEQRAELVRNAALLGELRKELEYESALLANAERQLELARRGLARLVELARLGRESSKARDDAESIEAGAEQTLLQRRQGVARLRARIEQQQAAHDKARATLASAERELSHTRVVAPFDGHVSGARLALGQRLALGESLGRLLATSALEARFALPEADFARLIAAAPVAALQGRPVRVRWRLGTDVREFAARITRVGAEIDATLGGIELFAVLEGMPARDGLRAGAFVEIEVPDVAYRGVFRLPARAVGGSGTVYVISEERLTEVPVEVVRALGDEVLVRGPLADGMQIVSNQFAGIGPGLRVRPL